jgi:hypothetical protein
VLEPVSQAAWAVPGASGWHAPHREPSDTPAPGACLHTCRRRTPGRLRVTAAEMKFAPDDWQGFFAAHGWKVKEMRDLAAEGERRGRPYVIPEALRAMFQQGKDSPPQQPPGLFAAYALMERA